MSVFYVFQGVTYQQERDGGYVWSPQKDSSGHNNIGYSTMTNVKKGDFILHNANGKIMAISIAKTDCYESNRPVELTSSRQGTQWANKGYRIDTNYIDLEKPVATTTHKQWLKDHYDASSAFTREGMGKQQYMCHLADEHAKFFLNKAIELQTNAEIIRNLQAALFEFMDDVDAEYNPVEKEEIEELLDTSEPVTDISFPGIREQQAVTTSPATGREIPKRNSKRAADALKRAHFHCENNESVLFLERLQPF